MMRFVRRILNKDQERIKEYQQSRETISRLQSAARPATQPDESDDATQNDAHTDAPATPDHENPPTTVADETDSDRHYLQDATTVAAETTFEGTLETDRNLYIEGNCNGELQAAAAIVIAEGAHVNAHVRATDVIVAGTLRGSVEARNLFHAMPSACVSAAIDSARLAVEEGSHINCRFTIHSAAKENTRV